LVHFQVSAPLVDVDDIYLFKFIAIIPGSARKQLQITRIGELVDIGYPFFGFVQSLTNDGTSDEAGATSNENNGTFLQ